MILNYSYNNNNKRLRQPTPTNRTQPEPSSAGMNFTNDSKSKYHHGIKDFCFTKDKEEEEIKIYAAYQRQEPDPYTPVKDKSSFYCRDYYGFEPCICKYIVVYDARTALFIAKDDL